MSDNRLVITDHAVQRYIERHARGATYNQGRDDLQRLLEVATPLKTKSINGQNLMRVDEPSMLLVVKPDAGRTVLVTVLPASAIEDSAFDDSNDDEHDMVAAYERIRNLVEKPSLTTVVEVDASVKVFTKESQAWCAKVRNEAKMLKALRKSLRSEILQMVDTLVAPDEKKIADVSTPTTGAANTKGAMLTELNNAIQQRSALESKLTRQVKHVALMEKGRSEARKALFIAVKMLMLRRDVPDVYEALELIAAIDSQFIEDNFWDRK